MKSEVVFLQGHALLSVSLVFYLLQFHFFMIVFFFFTLHVYPSERRFIDTAVMEVYG